MRPYRYRLCNIGLALDLTLVLTLGLMGLAACDESRGASTPDVRATTTMAASMPHADTLTAIGRRLFFDATLSASGHVSCASCHDSAYAWASPDARAVARGGTTDTMPGVRAVPGLAYAQDTPSFTEHFRENDGDDSEDQGPMGGFMWDGRAPSRAEQASMPLLSPHEMGNASRTAVVERLRTAPIADALRAAFGTRVLDDTLTAWTAIVSSLDAFQQDPATFYPYTSKYDAMRRGDATLTAREQRGLALFNDPAKGNCASCHPSGRNREGAPQFTDRGLIALGAPRNRQIPANADTAWFDLGLCGPLRTDLSRHDAYCGAFKTPTLRNVARRRVFFHNGVFTSLEQVLRFYARRDLEPSRFYARSRSGSVTRYDDLPSRYHANVNSDPPFDRKPGQAPAFTEAEAADIIAFLQTLTDGYWRP